MATTWKTLCRSRGCSQPSPSSPRPEPVWRLGVRLLGVRLLGGLGVRPPSVKGRMDAPRKMAKDGVVIFNLNYDSRLIFILVERNY